VAVAVDPRTSHLADAVRAEQRTMRLGQIRDVLSVAGWVAVSAGSAAVAVSEVLRRGRR
jgi:hypothetical protein